MFYNLGQSRSRTPVVDKHIKAFVLDVAPCVVVLVSMVEGRRMMVERQM